MQAESGLIEQPLKTSRGTWWGVMLVVVLSGLIYFMASDWTSTVLTDGTKVYYRGYVRGAALPHSEFEEALYAYSGDHFAPPGILEMLQRAFKGRGATPPEYGHAPLLLKVRVGAPDGSRFQGRICLQDDFGDSQELYSTWPPLFCNDHALPRRSPWLAFRFQGYSEGASGLLKIRNPYYNSTRAFAGKQVPLNATTPAGTVQLRQAVWRPPENLESESPNWPSVLLEFDVSQCADLLPCHVIGVRITDCLGNSELVDGSLATDGRTVKVIWEPRSRDRATLQDFHWRVRLALCRGLGAQMPLSRVAAFESIRMENSHFAETRSIGSQKVMLRQFGSEKRSVEQGLWLCLTHVQLPGAALDDWPALTRVTGHLTGGGAEVFDPRKVKEEFADFNCHPVRVTRNAHGPSSPITIPTFDMRYWVPAAYESVDLQFAIERPEVFQFDVQVADWPEQAEK
jgi:hypothetical protein